MSRVGKLSITLPAGVKVETDDLYVKAIGSKGELSRRLLDNVKVVVDNSEVKVLPIADTKHAKAMWGTARSLINGMIEGVSKGFTKELEVNGVGYRAIVKGKYLNLTLGKSHNTKIEIPSYVKVEAPKQNVIIVESIDKEKLGQFVSILIKQRPPEPYKGKGIKVKGQYVQRKEGKKN